VPQVSGNGPVRVEKLHGCCLMVLASFLEEIGYLDDTVFLYSEEPILAAQVRNAGKRLMLFPRLTAVHAHVASTKGNSSRRMLTYIRSRLYYLSRYSGYGAGTLTALRLSYRVLWLLHFVKAQARTDRSANSKRKDSAA
jgi:GT2 family glycosyltransferase